MTATELRYDPYDYRIDADPHPVWRRLREEAPVYRNDEHDFWALSRFEDVLTAHLDPATFSSAHGTVLELMGEPFPDPPLLFMDPPQHTRMRAVVNRAFTPRRVAALEARIRELCAGYLDPFRDAAGFDYVADFGARLPVMVISSLLGAPPEDQEDLQRWSDETLHRDPGETAPGPAALEAGRRMHRYWEDHLAARRLEPRDDLVSDLAHADLEDDDGSARPLTDAEVLSLAGTISAAGNETVARTLGWAARVLAAFPSERARLHEDPARIPNAVEELLRYESPSPVQGRLLTRPFAAHGEEIPAGGRVLLLTGAANRDPRAFDDPDRFDVGRTIHRHVAFGYGIHFCLGAALARLELRVALEETLRRWPEWDVDEAGCEMVHTSTVRGYARVPIRVGQR